MNKIKVKMIESLNPLLLSSDINDFIEEEQATIIGPVSFNFRTARDGKVTAFALVTYSVYEESEETIPADFVNVFINEDTGTNKEYNSDRAIYDITCIMEDLITGGKVDDSVALELIDEALKLHYGEKDDLQESKESLDYSSISLESLERISNENKTKTEHEKKFERVLEEVEEEVNFSHYSNHLNINK